VSSTHLGLTTRLLLLADSCGFVDVGRSLWRENGSAVYNFCWSSPAQSFLGRGPTGLVTIFCCIRFETPPTWMAGSPYVYPPGTGWPSYPPRHSALVESESESYVTTDGQSASLPWNKAHIWGLCPELYYCRTFAGLLTWALFLTRGQVCCLQLLLALASADFLGSESLGSRDHILLSQFWDFPFRRLLRLAGSRWRYSTPLPHEFFCTKKMKRWWTNDYHFRLGLFAIMSHASQERAVRLFQPTSSVLPS
jgi:hypothetical protein